MPRNEEKKPTTRNGKQTTNSVTDKQITYSITEDKLDKLINSNHNLCSHIVSLQEKFVNAQTEMCETMKQMFTAFTSSQENSANHNTLLLKQIEKLSDTISNTNQSILPTSTSVRHTEQHQTVLPKAAISEIESKIKAREHVYWKHFRSETLISYYSDLINLEKPFVPPKFRVKADRNTLDKNIELKKQQAIDNTKREIEMMTNQCEQWSTQLKTLEAEVHEIIQKNITDSDIYANEIIKYDKRMKEDEITNENEYSSNLKKLKRSYEIEMQEKDQFLIIFTDERENSNTSKNYPGRGNRFHNNRHQQHTNRNHRRYQQK